MPEQAIGLGGINVQPDRLRALRPEVVAELAASMAALGLIQPITVRPRGRSGDGYWLIAGVHRFEAAKRLKWPSILARVLDGVDADQAEVIELDENLVRADLTPAERALHVGRRKELYEKLHPETRAKVAGGKARQGKASDNLSFAKSTAKATGKNKRSVERDAARARIVVLSGVVGSALDQGDELDALAKMPEDEQRKLAARAKAGEKVSAKHHLKKLKRTAKEQKLGGAIAALPDKKYGVILEDFEWDFKVRNRDTGMDRHAANHYETAADAHTPEEIIERTKDRFAVAADDCVLFMWVPIPFLAIGIHVLEGRGFAYKSSFVWGKDKIGTGYWNREKHEYLLIGVKGKIPAPAQGDQFDSLIMALRGGHSEKPDFAYEIIERYFPTLPKLELNLRGKPRHGWDGWGNEAEDDAAAE